MSETKTSEVINWLRKEADRAAKLRTEKNEDGSWKRSAHRRSTLWKRCHMLRQAAKQLTRLVREGE